MDTEQHLEKSLLILFNEGAILHYDLDALFEKIGAERTPLEKGAFINKAHREDLLSFEYTGTWDSSECYKVTLTTNGQKIMDTHKTYSAYLKSIKKKERGDSIDRNIKNGNLIASVLVAGAAVYVTLLSIGSKKEQQKIREGIQSISTQLDSLKQILQQKQEPSSSKQKPDTATSISK